MTATRENERRPAREHDALRERETARAVGRGCPRGLRIEEPREHDPSIGRGERRDRCCEPFERIEQNICKDDGVGRAFAQSPLGGAGGMHDPNILGDAIDARIGARRRYRARIDIACDHRPPQRLGGSDGQHARTGADVEHGAPGAARAAVPLRDAIEREQATAGTAVMAGAEGEPRLDLNSNTVDANAGAVMRPMHDEATGLDRLEAFEARAHPVGGCEHLEAQASRSGWPCDRRDERANGRFVRFVTEMQRERPAFLLLRNRDGNGLSVAAFRKRVVEPSGGGRIGGEPCNYGVAVR